MATWLYKNDTQVWHLWPGKGRPSDGDEAWCGLQKDDTCVAPGDPDVTTKCPTCQRNVTAR